VAGLQEAGFEIEQHPVLGYRLLSSPDRLIADDLWARLGEGGARRLLREIMVFSETGSTNDVASRLGAEGLEGGILILAERQTAGRGRFGRAWLSAAGRGIWMSLLLRPDFAVTHWARLTTWAALAISAGIDRTANVRSTIKWPNDVQWEGKKVAGILIEMGAVRPPFAVVGAGVNVNHEVADFPPELTATATSLRLAARRPLDRAALLVAILEEMEARYPLLNAGFDRLVAEAEGRSGLLGQWVRAKVGDAVVEGVAEELDGEGHLMLRQQGGTMLRLIAGEVTLAVG
jgi:BirA family biotin operon repressor/biotin-[acetyl-CoA-carboxylase] ligase